MSRQRHPIVSFKRQVIVFAALVGTLALVIAFFSFSQATVTVTPAVRVETARATLPFVPEAADAAANALHGTLLTERTTNTITVDDLPGGEQRPGFAEGDVTITNRWSQTQPLAAGTRLLSDGGVLFRTAERIDVPAGGAVTVRVTADQEGAAGNIGPSHFTIVALWAGLQSQIDGASTTAFTGGLRSVTTLDAETVADTHEALLDLCAEAVLASVKTQHAERGDALFLHALSVVEETPSAQTGDTVDGYTNTMTADVTVIIVPRGDLLNTLAAATASQRAADTEVVGILPDTIATRVSSVQEDGTASLEITADVQTELTSDAALLDPSNVVGKSKADILAYFRQFDAVANVDVRFTPPWLLRAPQLPDHIHVKLNAAGS